MYLCLVFSHPPITVAFTISITTTMEMIRRNDQPIPRAPRCTYATF